MAAVDLYLYRIDGGYDERYVEMILDASAQRGVVTILDAGSVFSSKHLSSAYMHAARAILRGVNRAREHSLEVVRWAAGSRQVGEGLERCGPSPTTRILLLGITSGDWPSEGDDVDDPEIRSGDPDDLDLGIEGLVPLRVMGIEILEEHLGGPESLPRLGLDEHRFVSRDDMELAVLENVAFAALG